MKILVIEDETKVASFLRKGLQQSGYEVDIAANGEEGQDKFRAGEYDLILLDLVIPEMSGLDVLKELKQSGKYDPLVKVVIFSNLSDKSEQDKAFALGADGFISKSQSSRMTSESFFSSAFSAGGLMPFNSMRYSF